MEESVEGNHNSLSLEYMCKLEQKRIPGSLQLICETVEKKHMQYENDLKRLYSELSTKQDKVTKKGK